MATVKKATTVKEEVKEVAAKAEVKPAVKAAIKAEAPKAEAKPVAKKETVKKETVKKEAKAPAKKAETKTAAKKAPAKKATVKETISVQFDGKSYTTEDLVNIAKDVWKYDLNQKAADFKSVELYVKPEEAQVYYVINGDVTGSFGI